MTSNNHTPLHRLLALCSVCCCITAATAQEGAYRYLDATQLWRLTDNAAGLGLDAGSRDLSASIGDPLTRRYNRGWAEFSLEHGSGDYHRVQEGGQRNQLRFETERYQRIGRYLVGYGHFLFGMDRTKDRAWADVMRPYDANPFYSGSSAGGKYDSQTFDLTAAVATIPIPLAGEDADRELTLGLRLDYKVSDLSRLRDPRSRSELLDYEVAPGVTYASGRHALGLSGFYNRRKEKIPSITTVQQDPNLVYYQMYGLGEATGTVGGYSGFQREWVDHRFGAELTYSLTTGSSRKEKGAYASSADNYGPEGGHYPSCSEGLGGGYSSLSSIAIARGSEDAWGQYKFSPGRYISYIYKATSRHRIGRGRRLHSIDLEAQWQQAYADEYRQLLVQEKDAGSGYTSYRYDTQISYGKRQQLTTVDARLHYRLNYLRTVCRDSAATAAGTPAVGGYLGVSALLSGAHSKHLLPTSEFRRQRLGLSLEGGCALLKGRLWLDAEATWSHATRASLDLADPTTPIATQVLLPDMDYYDADFFRAQLSAKYLFPITIKGHRNTFYLKAYGDILAASHSQNRNTAGITLGIFN